MSTVCTEGVPPPADVGRNKTRVRERSGQPDCQAQPNSYVFKRGHLPSECVLGAGLFDRILM